MEFRDEELLITVLAGLIEGARHVAVGAASPIPAAAALLAQATGAAPLRVTVLHSRRQNHFTDGGRELFDSAGQGRVDTFFLGGVQIDGQANINLVGTGDYPNTTRRFPGSFGSAFMYFTVPRVILFREEHSRRVLVPRVDFVSAPGTSPANVKRPGGPRWLVTGKAVFAFDPARRRFRLERRHPGHGLEELRDETGFDFDVSENLAETAPPSPEQLDLVRGRIAQEIAEPYPAFAQRLFGVAAA